MNLKAAAHPDSKMGFKNMVFVNPGEYQALASRAAGDTSKFVNVTVNRKVFPCTASELVPSGSITLGLLQRSYASTLLDEAYFVEVFSYPDLKSTPFTLAQVEFKVSTMSKTKQPAGNLVIESEDLMNEIKPLFRNFVMGVGLKLVHFYKASNLLQLEVVSIRHSSVEGGTSATGAMGASGGGFKIAPEFGLFVDSLTQAKFQKTEGVQIRGQQQEKSVNKMLEVNFEDLGIGGLDNEFSEIFRRAFASRIYPANMVRAMGLNHCRGLMLYGPPGCGKTLIARQISKALSGSSKEDKKREPKVVNGPELLSKFVGETEKNLRELFTEAENDQAENGDESELHVIIFDEFDAIAKKRGSSRDGSGVHDSIVNQLLSKIDGVDALNNILLIGMTNRLDMLDSALLRPGRFEIQVEISLPDQAGRVQILNIHTSRMKAAGYLGDDVQIEVLAEQTKNFTGAEIEGLVKGASSYAFQRQVDSKDFRKVINPTNLKVTREDFDSALLECKPMFGNTEAEEEMKMHQGHRIIAFSQEFENVQHMLSELVKESASDTNDKQNLSLVSVLLSGEPGSGKTALAAKIAFESGFPLVRILSPDKLIGMSEQSKSSYIADIFDQAYKSTKSLILLEDVERIIDYSKMGPRFSNQVLQTLLILIRKPPPKQGRRLFIIGTTSVPELIQPLDLVSVFSLVLYVPQVMTPEEAITIIQQSTHVKCTESEVRSLAQSCVLPISVKKLLLALDMCQGDGRLDQTKFQELLSIA